MSGRPAPSPSGNTPPHGFGFPSVPMESYADRVEKSCVDALSFLSPAFHPK